MISVTALLIAISPLSGFAETEKPEKEVADTTDIWLN
ncbi:cystatin-like fold containing conserved bacterial protein, partial [Crocosphaera watsonii WH 0003]